MFIAFSYQAFTMARSMPSSFNKSKLEYFQFIEGITEFPLLIR